MVKQPTKERTMTKLTVTDIYPATIPNVRPAPTLASDPTPEDLWACAHTWEPRDEPAGDREE